jgi:hypothetical protein
MMPAQKQFSSLRAMRMKFRRRVSSLQMPWDRHIAGGLAPAR